MFAMNAKNTASLGPLSPWKILCVDCWEFDREHHVSIPDMCELNLKCDSVNNANASFRGFYVLMHVEVYPVS